MSAVLPVLACLVLYALGYLVYARFLSDRVFGLDASRPVPSETLRDDVDYLPTPPAVLFGHHFASITGLAPILGPAVAVIWGWLPAMLWVVLGALLVGCVHDLSALVLSLRARGLSIGVVAEGVIGRRAMALFHLIIFFGVSLAMGVFVFVIARLFSVEIAPGVPGYPQAVGPSALIMLLAVCMGLAARYRGIRLGPMTAVSFALVLGSVWVGGKVPTLGLPAELWPGPTSWTWLLMLYALAASILPVWSLLQPRDFLNSLLLYLGLGLCYIGFAVHAPEFQAPAVNANPEGAPSLFPFVFIVIACGAASGFHGLVSSGTTAKQLASEAHARPVAYGGMIGESLLGLLAVIATTAGMASAEEWHGVYTDWGAIANNLAGKIDVFIGGSATFLEALGIQRELGASFMAIIVVSFALTTLDSATRILRFNIEEMVRSVRLPSLFAHRVPASLAAVAVIYGFATLEIGGKPMALALWTLFGTTNQLLAGLTLLVATLYLWQRGRAWVFTALPMLYMLGTTLTAMVKNFLGFATPESPTHSWLLGGVGGALLVMGVWICVEGALAVRRGDRFEGLDVPLEDAAAK